MPPEVQPDARVLLPVVRRLLQVGAGPGGLADWAGRLGVPARPRPGWTADDEWLAADLAARLERAVAPARGRTPPDTVRTDILLLTAG